MRAQYRLVPTAVGASAGVVDGLISAKRPNVSWAYEAALGAVGAGLTYFSRRFSDLGPPLQYGAGFELSARGGYALADKVRSSAKGGPMLRTGLPANVVRGIRLQSGNPGRRIEPAGISG